MTTILLAVITTGRCCCLLAPVDFDDSVLVDVLENVRSVHQNSNRAGSGYDEEDVQLQPIDHHRYVLPVLAGLDVQILVPQMLRDELYSFGSLARLR